MDVKKTIRNGRLTEKIYMKQPIGFDDGTGQVCKLVKPIYGLKQAENIWNNAGFQIYTPAKCSLRLAFCGIKKKKIDYYHMVDDMVGVANTKETNDKFVQKLVTKYKIKVIGELYMLLGMHITPDYENHTI